MHRRGRPRLQITGVTVGVVIRDRVATTMMEIQLRNPAGTRQEAELLVPVPDGAVVRGLRVPGNRRRAVGPAAVSRRGAGDLRSHRRPGARPRAPRVCRVQPGALERFPGRAGRDTGGPADLRTSAAGERRSGRLRPAAERVGRIHGSLEDRGQDHRRHADHGGLLAEPSAADRAAEADRWPPSSSRRTPGPSPARSGCRSSASAPTFRPRSSPIPTPRSAAATSCSWPGLPPQAAKPDSAGLKREVTLVIDRSGSMRGEKLAQVREAALQVLAGLDDGEAFNVILYNEGVEPFADRPVRKSRATIKDATEFLEGMTARGGTNIHDALLEALRQPPAEGTLPIVLFMTDGLATVGQTSEAAIRELARKGNPHGRRIFTFGVGVDVNTPLLEKIAYESRATTTFVLPGEDVEVKVAAVFQRLQGPGARRSRASPSARRRRAGARGS